MNENVKNILFKFSKYRVQVLVDVVEKRLQNHDSEQTPEKFYLPISRNRFVKGGFTLCVEKSVEDGRSIRDRSELQKPV